MHFKFISMLTLQRLQSPRSCQEVIFLQFYCQHPDTCHVCCSVSNRAGWKICEDFTITEKAPPDYSFKILQAGKQSLSLLPTFPVEALSVIVKLREGLFPALVSNLQSVAGRLQTSSDWITIRSCCGCSMFTPATNNEQGLVSDH